MAVSPLASIGSIARAAPPNAANSTNNTDTSNTTKKASTDDAKAATVNYDSFLRLLVEQLKNQDPTDPMDATEQMSQLASFSNVEQGIKTNSHLESLIQQANLSTAASWIGQTITSADGKTSGTVSSVDITADGVTATLANGKEVVIETGITVKGATSNTTK